MFSLLHTIPILKNNDKLFFKKFGLNPRTEQLTAMFEFSLYCKMVARNSKSKQFSLENKLKLTSREKAEKRPSC